MTKRYIVSKIRDVHHVETPETFCEKLVADVMARFYRIKGDSVYFPMIHSETSEKIGQICQSMVSPGDDGRMQYLEIMRNFQKDFLSVMHLSADAYLSTLGGVHARVIRQFLDYHLHPIRYRFLNIDSYGYCQFCNNYSKSNQFGVSTTCKHRLHPLGAQTVLFNLKATLEKTRKMYQGNDPRIKTRGSKPETWFDNLPNEEFLGCGANDKIHNVPSWVDNCLAYWTHANSWPVDLLVTSEKHVYEDAILLPSLFGAAEWLPPKKIAVMGRIETPKEMQFGTICNRHKADAVRYYLLNRNPTKNLAFDEAQLISMFNDRLFLISNLAYRIADMANRYGSGVLAAGIRAKQYNWIGPLEFEDYTKDMESLDFDKVLDLADKIACKITGAIIREQTWNVKTTPKQDIIYVIKGLVCGIRILVTLLKPFVPNLCQRIETVFDYPKPQSWQYIKLICQHNNTSGMTKEIRVEDSQPIYDKRRRYTCTTTTKENAAYSYGV